MKNLIPVVLASALLVSCSESPSLTPTSPTSLGILPASGSNRITALSNRDTAALGTIPTGLKANPTKTDEGNEKVQFSWFATTNTTRYELKWERCSNLGCPSTGTWQLKGSTFAYDIYYDRYINESGFYRAFVRAYLGNVAIGGWSEPAYFSIGPNEQTPDPVVVLPHRCDVSDSAYCDAGNPQGWGE
jgi:hypothetical protein